MNNESEKSIRAKYIEKMKKGIEEYRKRNESITGGMGDIAFSVSDEDSFKISFSNSKDGKKKVVVIDEEGSYSEVEVVNEKRKINYTSRQGIDEPLLFSRTVNVINGEEVNEYYSIKSESRDGAEAEILQEILGNNTEYSIEENGEFSRERIDPSENVKRFVYSKLEGFFIVERIGAEAVTYGDYVEEARKFEEKCRGIYELFVAAYEELGIKSEKSELDAELETGKEDTETRQEKIERAKSLMELSRTQDAEIAALKSQVQEEGIDLDE